MATNGNLNEKKTHRICLKLSSRSVVADYFGVFFPFRHCRVFLSNSRDIRDTQQMACSSLSLPQAARTAPAPSTKYELRGC
jgi:hypothetical protein